MGEHIITVRKLPGEDDFDFIVKQCPADARCTYWVPCERCDLTRLELTEAEDAAGAYFAHGEQHESIEDAWGTSTGRCALELDGAQEGLYELARDHGTGVHEAEVGYWGDGIWEVIHIRTLTRPRQLLHKGRKPRGKS
ncbi:hypothetical protein [Arthrobacter woluwensis]|uniref:hypothetical protein n=1 Tax=Arthrobacter woluwensis TaxID=156980 RepID=UPI00119F61CC|nr:hypothetical protein [Arthrobacter woluwensis]QTF70598.1 hypothetical protein G8758_00155 [Arthrobacter woluwensis]